jgi:hypothetical protein
MAEIINLNKVRKARAKAGAQQQAAENRIRHGRTKAEKQAERAATEAAAKKLDGHHLAPKDEDG